GRSQLRHRCLGREEVLAAEKITKDRTCRKNGAVLSTTVSYFRFARHSAGNQNRAARLHTRGVCRISSASSYSPRKASMGSVLVARLAGSAEAASASSSIAMTESARTPGSNGLTSRRTRDANEQERKERKEE